MAARERGPGGGPPPARSADSPPPGPPWDAPLEEAELCFVDLEMTGLEPASDRVIELCLERVKARRDVDHLESLVRPDCGRFGNAHVHGITPADVAAAPTFADLAGRVENVLGGAVLVAHGAAWDVAFLQAELARAGRPLSIPHYLDTLNLSQRAFALPSHSLASLSRELGLPRDRAHRAGDDVRALRALFDRLVEVLKPKTPRDLWHVRVGQRHARPEVVAAALEALEAATPVRIRYRPARRGLEELEVMVTAVRTDLDPPRVLGYLLPTRSRRELRADRILSIEAGGPAVPPPSTG